MVFFIYIIKEYLIMMCLNKLSLRSQNGREILFLVLLTRTEALESDLHWRAHDSCSNVAKAGNIYT
jgi:hypothetical protein